MISIITPTLNSERYIERTLSSIWDSGDARAGDTVEHIVVDGMSTDHTLEIVAGYPSIVISGKDGSMYEAINKGLAAASGDVFGYVNSDDELTAGATAAVAAAFASRPDKQWLVAPVVFVDGAGTELATLRPPRWLSPTRFRALGWNCLPQPSTFFRTSFARDLGGFDTDFRLVADYDFFIKALQRTRPIRHNRPLARFRLHAANLSKDHASMAAEARRAAATSSIPAVRRTFLRWLTKLQVNATNPAWALAKRTGKIRY